MEDCCSCRDEDPGDLDVRVRAFAFDRSAGSVTGIRRMGRIELVDMVSRILESEGRRVMRIPGTEISDPDVLLFDDWRDIDEELISEHPDADVLFGQDLCHQVPAVVRALGSHLRPVIH